MRERGRRETEERKKRERRERWVRYGGRRERLDLRDPLSTNQMPSFIMPRMCVCLEIM
jgi:hypothetical protein